MAEAKRRDDAWSATPASPPPAWAEAASDQDCRPGGKVGQMQADLAHRLAWNTEAVAMPAPPGERVARFLSITGGYAALLAGYVGAAFLVVR